MKKTATGFILNDREKINGSFSLENSPNHPLVNIYNNDLTKEDFLSAWGSCCIQHFGKVVYIDKVIYE